MEISKKRQERRTQFESIDLYVVTCETLSRGRSNFDVLDAVIKGGGKIIQLRDKELDKRNLYSMAEEFRRITTRSDIMLIINDHLDIALAVDADGVHLGQDDLPLEAAREIAPHLIIGQSTHSIEQVIAAQNQGADYINIGPIFPTETKEHPGAFLGPQVIPEFSQLLTIPFTVMGGIKESNIKEVIQKGAKKVALVTAVTMADDMIYAVRNLRQYFV